MNHCLVSVMVRNPELTYPDVAAEPDGKDRGEDDDTPSPELVAGLVLPIGIGLHQENAPGNQLWTSCPTSK